MKLISNETGKELAVGDTVRSFNGEMFSLSGWREPQHAASTGRVFVKNTEGFEREFFPAVINARFVDSEPPQ